MQDCPQQRAHVLLFTTPVMPCCAVLLQCRTCLTLTAPACAASAVLTRTMRCSLLCLCQHLSLTGSHATGACGCGMQGEATAGSVQTRMCVHLNMCTHVSMLYTCHLLTHCCTLLYLSHCSLPTCVCCMYMFLCRPTMEERMKLSCTIHAWRESLGVSKLLQQPPHHFDCFQQHLVLRPLLKTPKGQVVLLLKVCGWDSTGMAIG